MEFKNATILIYSIGCSIRENQTFLYYYVLKLPVYSKTFCGVNTTRRSFSGGIITKSRPKLLSYRRTDLKNHTLYKQIYMVVKQHVTCDNVLNQIPKYCTMPPKVLTVIFKSFKNNQEITWGRLGVDIGVTKTKKPSDFTETEDTCIICSYFVTPCYIKKVQNTFLKCIAYKIEFVQISLRNTADLKGTIRETNLSQTYIKLHSVFLLYLLHCYNLMFLLFYSFILV